MAVESYAGCAEEDVVVVVGDADATSVGWVACRTAESTEGDERRGDAGAMAEGLAATGL
jgi:hypothetical protein